MAASIAVALLTLPPQVHPDTSSYLAHAPERAPLYPFVLDVFHALFGPSALSWLARFQALAILAAGALFSVRIGRLLKLGVLWRLGLFLLLCAPGLKFSSAILAEPLAFAVLVAFWALLASETLPADEMLLASEARGERRGPCLWLPLLCAVAVLLRPQSIFLPVTYGVFLLGRLALRRDRASCLALGLLLLAMMGGTALRGADNAWRNGSFSTASSGGVHLLASVLYIAEQTDQTALDDPQARELFRRSLARAEDLKLTRRHWDMSRSHFDVSMERLVFEVVRPELAKLVPTGALAAAQGESAEALALSVAKGVVLHRPFAFAALLGRKVYDGQPFYYALLVLVAGFAFSIRRREPVAGLFALAALQSCLSYGVILLAGVYSLRYLLPADAIVLALALALGGALLQAHNRGQRESRAILSQGDEPN